MTVQITRESIEGLFKQLLLHSRELENAVLQEESSPEEWLERLEKREELLEKIADAIGQGFALPNEWKQQYTDPFIEVDQRLIALMKKRQDVISGKIAQIQRGKAVNKQYSGYAGSTAYGAFFDEKK